MTTLLGALGSQYLRYQADSYNTSSRVWKDSSPNNKDISISSFVGLTVESFTNNDKTFSVIHGTTSTQIQFLCESLPHYTLFHVAKYSGQGARGRIFTPDNSGSCGSYINWLSGFWGGNSGVAYHGSCEWLTAPNDIHQNNWVVSAETSKIYRSNGVPRGITGCSQSLQSLAINKFGDENSDFMVVDVIIVKEELSLSEIEVIEKELMTAYGLIGKYELFICLLHPLTITLASQNPTDSVAQTICTTCGEGGTCSLSCPPKRSVTLINYLYSIIMLTTIVLLT